MSKARTRLCRAMMMLACGGSLMQINSCNPSVRDAILTGLETTSLTFANTLITALFDGFGDPPP
jgi:hypothetical protein